MALTKEITDDAELAKSYITNSQLSDDYKRTYLRLINISTMATNGISADEKIQKMTECIQLLAITQGMYLANIDKKIDLAIKNANAKKCEDCKAMAHTEEAEKKQNEAEIIEKYKKQMGLTNNQTHSQFSDMSWNEVFKSVFSKPYVYVIGCLMVISPYGAQILKMILDFYSK